VALVLEILLAYVELLRVLRGGDLASMVRTARHTPFQAQEALGPADEHFVARRLGWIVFRVVDTLPTDKRCLINSLVLVRVLTHRSIGAQLVLGVQSEGGFAAHAWVEHAGRPVMPTYDFHRLFEV